MPARVVLVSIDAFQTRHLTPGLTPRLWALAQDGGFAPDGGVCDLPSVTYPSHATLLSGRHGGSHGVLTGMAGHPTPGFIPGWAGEDNVARRTLFDACNDAGVWSAAVLGDQNLVRILDADAAANCWPPNTAQPPADEADAHGYRTNAVIQPHVLRAASDRDNRFVFVHYNETDTVGHRHGPDAPEALACYAATDALIGELIETLRPSWPDLVLIVVSDHGMELLPGCPPIRLLDHPAVAAIASDEIDEAGAALLRLRDAVEADAAISTATEVEGVASARLLAPGVLLVEAEPGLLFGSGPPPKAVVAGHGGRTTARTLAVVGGGYPAVVTVARSIAERPPHLADWAPTIATMLGIALPDVDGQSLV